jgi:hypothetical protein
MDPIPKEPKKGRFKGFKERRIYPFLMRFRQKSQKFLQDFRKHTRKHKEFYKKMQLTSIHLCANIVLMANIRNCLGTWPTLFSYLPFSKGLIESPLATFLSSPERTFVIYILILQCIVLRPVLRFSIIVKYQILLIFLLEMIENILLCIWDLLFGRELDISNPFGVWTEPASYLFITCVFCIFFFVYQYIYFQVIQGKFPKFPKALQKIPDSTAFWLKLKKESLYFDKKDEEK